MAAVAASHMARLRYGEPRFDILFLVPRKFPDCETDGSIPANAASLSADSKRSISPISLRIAAPKVSPIPVIVVIEYSAQVEHPEPLRLNSRVARNEHLRR